LRCRLANLPSISGDGADRVSSLAVQIVLSGFTVVIDDGMAKIAN
jgi:hypothetical protein